MFPLLLLSLLCNHWQVASSNANIGTFSFEEPATGPRHVCAYTTVRFHCIVTFILDGGTKIIRNANWKVHGIHIRQSTSSYILIKNSNYPSQVVGLQINHAQPQDNGTVYTCTDDLAPDNFTSSVILNVTENGCSNKHELGAPYYAGIGAGALALCLILVVAIIILVYYLRRRMKLKSRNNRYILLQNPATSAANQSGNFNAAINASTPPNNLPTITPSITSSSVTNTSTTITDRPYAVTSTPSSVTSRPYSVTSTPSSVTSRPYSVTSTPSSVTSRPYAVTSTLPAITSSLPAITSRPPPPIVTSRPYDITSTPSSVTSTPHVVTSRPPIVSSAVTRRPGDVITSSSTNITSAVTCGSFDVTSRPPPATSTLPVATSDVTSRPTDFTLPFDFSILNVFQGSHVELSTEMSIAGDDPDHAHHNKLIDQIWEICDKKFSKKQVNAALELNDQNGDDATEFLTSGLNLQKILQLLFAKSQKCPVKIVKVNQSTQCSDLISFYKDPTIDFSNCGIAIHLKKEAAIDGGGVRRQVYTMVLKQLSENKHGHIFQGKKYHLRPYYTASAMDTDIYKVLGCIVGHSIVQEGIGFPYLSPLCYWYIAAGKTEAMQHYTDDDVGAGCNYLITKLNKANTVDEVAAACSSTEAQDLLESAGVIMQVMLHNKDKVVQLVKIHEALFSIKILLDQFKDGLKNVKVLDLIQSFPNEFAPLFTSNGEEISANEVVEALSFGSSNRDTIAMEFLKQYISNLSQEDLQSFMICITGTTCIQDQKIMVNFSNDLEQIKISTCSREIFMPFGVCKRDEYGKFKSIMDAAIKDDNSFNHV